MLLHSLHGSIHRSPQIIRQHHPPPRRTPTFCSAVGRLTTSAVDGSRQIVARQLMACRYAPCGLRPKSAQSLTRLSGWLGSYATPSREVAIATTVSSRASAGRAVWPCPLQWSASVLRVRTPAGISCR
jgi:hypothetical protein